jgi:DNA (cytosine-5)-methyltransferase 1
MRRPLIWDLFCGVGGASYGYYEAGFEPIGIDIKPQPRYPFRFIRLDVTTLNSVYLSTAPIHASPPCQKYTVLNSWNLENGNPDLIPFTREFLKLTGQRYIIENVPGSPLEIANIIELCGSMFGLAVRRHRWFETNWKIKEPFCKHKAQDYEKVFPRRVSHARGTVKLTGTIPVHGGQQLYDVPLYQEIDLIRWAMGIYWTNRKEELNEAIPPAYTHFIGERLLHEING